MREWPRPRVTGEPVLEVLAPDGFQGIGYIEGKALIMVSKGVGVVIRVVASTDWLVLRKEGS